MGGQAVTYLRILLSVLAAIFIALLGPWVVVAVRDIGQQRATGLTAIAVGPLTPLFWIVAVSFFALFVTASRLNSKVPRIILFKDPGCHHFVVGTRVIFPVCIRMDAS